MDNIIDLIKRAIQYVKNLVTQIIDGVLSFARDVMAWFRGLKLDPSKDTPFKANLASFRDMLKTAPVKDVGIFMGVYNESKDEITNSKVIEADGLDDQTKKILGDEPLVVLN